MKRFSFVVVLLAALLFFPVLVLAAGTGTTTGTPTPPKTPPTTTPAPKPGTQTPPATPPANTSIGTFSNPVGSTNVVDFALRAMKLLVAVAGILTTVVLIISGFRLALANGNPKAITDARTAITYAIIGLVLAVLSFGIIGIVQSALSGKL